MSLCDYIHVAGRMCSIYPGVSTEKSSALIKMFTTDTLYVHTHSAVHMITMVTVRMPCT